MHKLGLALVLLGACALENESSDQYTLTIVHVGPDGSYDLEVKPRPHPAEETDGVGRVQQAGGSTFVTCGDIVVYDQHNQQGNALCLPYDSEVHLASIEHHRELLPGPGGHPVWVSVGWNGLAQGASVYTSRGTDFLVDGNATPINTCGGGALFNRWCELGSYFSRWGIWVGPYPDSVRRE